MPEPLSDLDRLAEMVAAAPSEKPGARLTFVDSVVTRVRVKAALLAVAPELIAVARDAVDEGDICGEHDEIRTWGCDICDALTRIDALKIKLAEVLGD